MASPIDRFEISLEHDIDEQYQHEPGEVLRGAVILQLNDTIKVKAIQVQIKGEAAVSWEDDSAKGPMTYRADETYIDVTLDLLPVQGDSQALGNGMHRYPLEYVLPDNLPSSFIGKFGSITYVVKATLKEDKRFGLNTMITSEPFLVLRTLDLSKDDNLMQQKSVKLEKRLWGACLFCKSGKVTANLKVNKTGHLPGEDIFMDAEILNESPRTVRAVQAALVMHSTFHAKTRSRQNTQIVNKKRDDWEMDQGDGRRWKAVRLTIPPYIPESRLDCCDIVDIQYELQFKVEVGKKDEMRISIPITVGTAHNVEGQPEKTKLFKGDNSTLVTDGEMNGEPVGPDDMGEFEIDEDEHHKFRHPMEPGGTRSNPIFLNA